MALTVEELLRPRIVLMVNYPGNTDVVGSIIHAPNFDVPGTLQAWVEYKEQYPEIFRKMHWIEERKVDDLPGFVKHHRTKEVCKVIKWGDPDTYAYSFTAMIDGEERLRTAINFLPATEAEFLAQNQPS